MHLQNYWGRARGSGRGGCFGKVGFKKCLSPWKTADSSFNSQNMISAMVSSLSQKTLTQFDVPLAPNRNIWWMYFLFFILLPKLRSEMAKSFSKSETGHKANWCISTAAICLQFRAIWAGTHCFWRRFCCCCLYDSIVCCGRNCISSRDSLIFTNIS